MEKNFKSIQRVSDSYLCSNCGACKTVCPKDAIEFKSSSMGRMYAFVSETCINCGICQKVCPSINDFTNITESENLLGHISSVRVGRAIDRSIYKNAQSGGVCTAILKFLFETGRIDGALICRMDYGSPVPIVKATIVRCTEELHTSQKSCYSPVELLGILKEEVENYRSLAIVGIGCHIEGIIGIEKINNKIKNKVYCKLGLICDRSLCGTIQDVYSSYAKDFGKIKINWKCKFHSSDNSEYSYKDAPLVIFNNKGKKKILPNTYRFVLKDLFTSPRCRVCKDKLNIGSDITLGDPWRMSNIDWENGESVVIGRTEKGEEILSEAIEKGYISLSPRTISELEEGQLIQLRKQQISKYSSAFSTLNPTIQTYLTNKKEGNKKTRDIDQAIQEFSEFIERENLSKQEIVSIARHKISKYKLESSLVFRALRKIYRCCKR